MAISPYNPDSDARLGNLKSWIHQQGRSVSDMQPLTGDAGFRRYFRLGNGQDKPLLAVDAPPEFEDTEAFVAINQRLATAGLRVPVIHCYNVVNGFLLIEDLGSTHLQDAIQEHHGNQTTVEAATIYTEAIRVLVQMQRCTDTRQLQHYDAQFLRTELELLREWYIGRHLQYACSHDDNDVIDRLFNTLIDTALEQPQVFVHRDYHCRNLMLADTDLALIDYQGALLGPVTYDAVSLLRDAYMHWPDDFIEQFMRQHHKLIAAHTDYEVYRRWFDFTGLQRHLKILGIFSRLRYRDNKPAYFEHLPLVCRHIADVLNRYDQFKDFNHLFKKLQHATAPAAQTQR